MLRQAGHGRGALAQSGRHVAVRLVVVAALAIVTFQSTSLVWLRSSPTFRCPMWTPWSRASTRSQLLARAASGDGKIVKSEKTPSEAAAKYAQPGLEKLNVKEEMQRFFAEEVAKEKFGINCWYESPDVSTIGQERVFEWWRRERPTRIVERVCGGKAAGGCSWRQLDGRRGVTFLRFNRDGEATYIREVGEEQVPFLGKFDKNPMAAVKPAQAVLEGFDNFFASADFLFGPNLVDRWLPKSGLIRPRSRRACDVVDYLWNEAQMMPDGLDRCLAEYADDVVYEDTLYDEAQWPRGKKAVRKYMEETKANSPKDLRWILDEVSDTGVACVAIWHCEALGLRQPRGASFYELNDEGKVCYVRKAYTLLF